MGFIDPKQIRKKAVSSINQDGLTDIMTGIIMLFIQGVLFLFIEGFRNRIRADKEER